VDSAISSGIAPLDNKVCCSVDFKNLFNVMNNSFSVSLADFVLFNSAIDESIGESDASPIKARRLKGKICDRGLKSKDAFN